MKKTTLKIKNEFITSCFTHVRNKSYIEKKIRGFICYNSSITYVNADKNKYMIYKDNRNKCGIYRLNNLISNKNYIGSSINLSGRFSNYYSLIYLKKRVNKGSSIIYNSILNYEYSSFSLDRVL